MEQYLFMTIVLRVIVFFISIFDVVQSTGPFKRRSKLNELRQRYSNPGPLDSQSDILTPELLRTTTFMPSRSVIYFGILKKTAAYVLL